MSADPPYATSGARPRPTDAEREARATWSGLAEPGDLVAGALVATLGAVDALRLVESAARGGLSRAWNEVVGQRVDGAVGADDDGLFP
ncbi:MAG TPA: hypothetical protein VNR62_07455, partial [Cellulomonas sp.]|nr:hypothetical protein [Cellulomonas sp.]